MHFGSASQVPYFISYSNRWYIDSSDFLILLQAVAAIATRANGFTNQKLQKYFSPSDAQSLARKISSLYVFAQGNRRTA
jgi:hypothetical protein